MGREIRLETRAAVWFKWDFGFDAFPLSGAFGEFEEGLLGQCLSTSH